MQHATDRQQLLIAALSVLCLIAYMLPWVNSPGVSLSMGAYDLAEWASLTPAARAESPQLLTSLLLRLPLACIAIVFALSVAHSLRITAGRWLGVAFVVMIVLLQLPPFAFATTGRHDPNYQQQFLVAVVTLFGGMLGISGYLRKWTKWIITGLVITGTATSLIGFLRAHDLMNAYMPAISAGMGAPLLILLFLLCLRLVLYKK
ncbi:MAG: hypothetical protein ACOCX5_04965 [Chloroflexota bacterium]